MPIVDITSGVCGLLIEQNRVARIDVMAKCDRAARLNAGLHSGVVLGYLLTFVLKIATAG